MAHRIALRSCSLPLTASAPKDWRGLPTGQTFRTHRLAHAHSPRSECPGSRSCSRSVRDLKSLENRCLRSRGAATLLIHCALSAASACTNRRAAFARRVYPENQYCGQRHSCPWGYGLLEAIRRRHFIGGSAASLLAALEWPSLSALAASHPHDDYAFFDERFEKARRIAASWPASIGSVAVQSDITPWTDCCWIAHQVSVHCSCAA